MNIADKIVVELVGTSGEHNEFDVYEALGDNIHATIAIRRGTDLVQVLFALGMSAPA